MNLDFSRLRSGEILAAVGGAALIGIMFMDWFSGAAAFSGREFPGGVPDGFLPGGAPPETDIPGIDAWEGLEFIDYVLLLTGMVGIKMAGIRVWGLKPTASIPMGALVTALAGIAMSLVIWRMVDPVAGGDLEIGIYLALVATAAIGAGGYLSSRADGFDFYEKL